jgi:DNA-binding MarR family transcriptional regulator
MSVMDESRKSTRRVTPGAPGGIGSDAVAGYSDASGSIGSDTIAAQLREVASLSTQFHRHVGHSLSVNDTDLAAMEHLMTNGPLTPTDLARHLGISTAAATVMVDRLTAVGHVHREPHAHDRRKVVVVPTPASVQAAFETLAPMFSGVAQLTAQLSESDHAVVTHFLSEVIGVFRGAIAAPDRTGT